MVVELFYTGVEHELTDNYRDVPNKCQQITVELNGIRLDSNTQVHVLKCRKSAAARPEVKMPEVAT